jgi:hypothetical protein
MHASLSNEPRGQVTSEDAKLIPIRTNIIRGPVNLFRLEYGRWWLIEKTGDEHFERSIALAQQGNYLSFEALNFVNGERALSDIRDALSAEFAPVSLVDVIQYFRFLEEIGVIVLRSAVLDTGA